MVRGCRARRGGKADGLYFKFKSIRQWTLLVLLTRSTKEREREEEEEEEGRKKRAEVRRSEGSRERRRIRGGWSFVKDCRQFPQGLVASGPPNKLFRG